MMKEIKVGLIKGRHEMPVNNYIFNEINDVLNFDNMSKQIVNFINNNINIYAVCGCGINQIGYEDVEVLTADTKLVVYVTGLTSVTAELIKVCALKGISLTLMHYNRETGDYLPQVIF